MSRIWVKAKRYSNSLPGKDFIGASQLIKEGPQVHSNSLSVKDFMGVAHQQIKWQTATNNLEENSWVHVS